MQPANSSEPPADEPRNIAHNRWDLQIEPHSQLFSLNINEIWRYRDLLFLFTRRDIVAFYKQTILGPLWFFLQPIFTTLIFVVVFGQIAGLSTDGAPQVLFYMCGITFWNYFSECFNKTSTVFKDNATLFGKVYFPRIIVPLSIVASNLTRFIIQFALFLALLAYFFVIGDVRPNIYMLFLPITVLIMAILGLSMGLLFSSLTTKYRDLVFVLQFGVQLLMYATPVIYPQSQIPDGIAPILAYNPLTQLFEVTRYGFLGSGSFSWGGLAYSAAFAVTAFIMCTAIFNKIERTFMDTV